MPGEKPTFTPFPGTAIFLGEPTRANRVFEDQFKNVVNIIVDLGKGNRIGEGQGAENFTAMTAPRFSVSSKGSQVLDHPKLGALRDRMKD